MSGSKAMLYKFLIHSFPITYKGIIKSYSIFASDLVSSKVKMVHNTPKLLSWE